MTDRLPVHALDATGTLDGSKALHGDGTWKAPAADANLTAHLADTSDAHDASAISVVPTGGIAATDVQAALTELDTEKAVVGHAHAATPQLLPVTTETNGVPDLVWDDNNNLVYAEAP